MKILCPIDFSLNSNNALEWAFDLLQKYDKKNITLLNCIHVPRNTGVIKNVEDIFIKTAHEDLEQLRTKYNLIYPSVDIDIHVSFQNPKSYIASYAKLNNFDWIIMGSKGDNPAKNFIIGSTTESTIEKSSVPMLIIPFECKFESLEHVVMGLDNGISFPNKQIVPIQNILQKFKSKLTLVQVKFEPDETLDYDADLIKALEDVNIEITLANMHKNIAFTLNSFAQFNDANALCLLHRKRGFFLKLFDKSTTIQELDYLKIPLMVVNER